MDEHLESILNHFDLKKEDDATTAVRINLGILGPPCCKGAPSCMEF